MEDQRDQLKREHKERLIGMGVSSRFIESSSDDNISNDDDILGHF